MFAISQPVYEGFQVFISADGHTLIKGFVGLNASEIVLLAPLGIARCMNQFFEQLLLYLMRILLKKFDLVDPFFNKPMEYGIDQGHCQ